VPPCRRIGERASPGEGHDARIDPEYEGSAMKSTVYMLAGLFLVSSLPGASLATAADRDMRLVQAAAEQDREAVRALLSQKLDVNAARADGATALLWAAHWNDLQMADLLLRAGANANAADDYGVTPLARASENASEAMVTKLLGAGANPNAAQKSGLTPLMVASRTGNVSVVKALIANGASINATTSEANATALMWAVSLGHSDVVAVLVEGGADVRVSTTKGITPLMFAARDGDIELAKVLLAAGADVNEPASDGTHVLPFAIVYGQYDMALFLLAQGADPNGAINGVRALHAAAGNIDLWLSDWYRRRGYGRGYRTPANPGPATRLEVVKALLAKGANANARIETSAMVMDYIGYPRKGAFEPFACGTGDLRGATPLWVAAYAANYSGDQIRGDPDQSVTADDLKRAEASAEILRVLLEAGGDLHLTTADGTTPLMVAAGLGRSTYTPQQRRGRRSPGAEEAVKLLLRAGARIDVVNEADYTALHGAAFRGLNEVVELLVDSGADINARDFKGRTPYRIAEGAKQSFQFQAWPETAAFIKSLGADTRLGVPGAVQERARDLAADAARAQQ
jgi:ankyrin repeat protein